jgi:hypothetical protein
MAMGEASWTELSAALDDCASAGRQITLWLRDDDAVTVTAALERLIELAGQWDVPAVLAVIPVAAEPDLAVRLSKLAHVRVAAHGFAHHNHAPAGEKKQELGSHRPAATVLDQLSAGFDRLATQFGRQAVPMLVPPWNRIAAELVPHLPRLGVRYLSTFGPAPPRRPVPGLLQVDCQLDIIDWRARGTHPHAVLAGRLAALVGERAVTAAPAPIGILTHHLDHDEAAWQFLERLFRLTARHPAVTWGWPVPAFTATT